MSDVEHWTRKMRSVTAARKKTYGVNLRDEALLILDKQGIAALKGTLVIDGITTVTLVDLIGMKLRSGSAIFYERKTWLT